MTTLYDVFRFFDEYELLEARIKYLSSEFKNTDISIRFMAFVPFQANNGTPNLVNKQFLRELALKYSQFSFIPFHIPQSWIDSNSRSAEDYCFEYVTNYLRESSIDTHYKCNFFAFSDLDEFYAFKDAQDAIGMMKYYDVVFMRMVSCFYRLDICSQDEWPGTFFLKASSINNFSLGTLKYSAHHPLRKNNIIKGGVHLSYFNSTLNSKYVNSHFVSNNSIRKIFAVCGLNPFLRPNRIVYPSSEYSEELVNAVAHLQAKEPGLIYKFLRLFITYTKLDIVITFTLRLFQAFRFKLS